MEAAPETISGFEKKAERIGLFAGTTEGRLLAWHLRELALPADVFTATEYEKKRLGIQVRSPYIPDGLMRTRWRNNFFAMGIR